MRFLFMRAFALLIWSVAVFIAFGVIVVSDARADAPVTQYQYPTWNTSWFNSAQEACAAATNHNSDTFVWQADGCHRYYLGQYDQGATKPNIRTACSDGSTPNTTKPLDQQCPKPPPSCTQDAGKVVPGSQFTIVSSAKLSNDFSNGINFCLPVSGTSGGCVIGASDRTGTVNLTTGKWEYIFRGPFTAVGKVCTGNGTGSTDPVKDPVQKCDSAAGMCSGIVNGVEVCVRCVQSDSTGSKTQTTVNADGSTTQTTTNTNVSFNDNSVTTNTTTTTTTTPAGGGTPTTTTKTDGTTESKDSYCSRNPNDANCKDIKSSFAGSCDASFACEGDAVQCAIAKEQYKRNCEIEKSPFADAMRQRAEGVSWDVPQSETDAINLDGKKNIKVDEKFNLTMQTVAQKLTTAGGAVCPTGQGVDFFAQHIEVSYEIPCRFATVVRAFVTLAAAFVAFRIFAAG